MPKIVPKWVRKPTANKWAPNPAKKQQQKQLDNLKKQAEEATKYKEISMDIRKAEAGLYFLKLGNHQTIYSFQ